MTKQFYLQSFIAFLVVFSLFTLNPNIADAQGRPDLNVFGSLSSFSANAGEQSSPQLFTVQGSNLGNNIVTVTAPTPFLVSLSGNSGFVQNISIVPSGGSVNGTIYVIYAPLSPGTNSGVINVSANGVGTKTVPVAGVSNTGWIINGSDMYNTNTGNIGIGTSTPKALLHITHPTDARLRIHTTSGGDLSFQHSQVSGSWSGLTHPYIIQAIEGSGISDMVFTPVTNSPSSGLVIKGSGNVGIGTASPTARLHVAGNVIVDNGKLGIGTNNPQAALDVNGTGNFTGFKLGDSSTAGYVLTSDNTGLGTWQPLFSGQMSMQNGMLTFSDSVRIAGKLHVGTSSLVLDGNAGSSTGNEIYNDGTSSQRDILIQSNALNLTGNTVLNGNTGNKGNVRIGPIPSRQPVQPTSRLSVYNSYNNQFAFMAPVAYLQANDDFTGTYYNMSLLKMVYPFSPNKLLLEANYFDGTNTNQLISISTTGKTVIGNANSTGTMLDVKGSGNFTGLNVSGTGSFTGITMNTGANTNGFFLRSDANGNASWVLPPSGLAPFFTSGTNNFTTPHAISYNTNSGLIGLGTSNPQSFVHMVGGDLRIDENPNSGNDINSDGTNEPGADVYLFDKNGKGLALTAQDGNGFLKTMSASMSLILGAGRFGEAIYIQPNNVVTIGTGMATTGSAAGYNLYVKNGILTEKLKIALSTDAANWSWPDFVFRKNYKLASLKEVESFINKNHHLAGVPSEAEVKANGIDVAEMDAALLKKIEELTLYIIDMKKEIDDLKEENQKIKNHIKK